LETEPIVRATSLAAHGSLAPVAGGPAMSATAAVGTAVAINPAMSLRRVVATSFLKPVFMPELLTICQGRRVTADGKQLR
jgi:hypothetical protein